uniref:Uncharacterized protein n=1 Tax=Arundo donax TaxID=35708 RepID=A0A0A8YSX8_ARUDO
MLVCKVMRAFVPKAKGKRFQPWLVSLQPLTALNLRLIFGPNKSKMGTQITNFSMHTFMITTVQIA